MSDSPDIKPLLENWLRQRIVGAKRVSVDSLRKPAAGESSDTQLCELRIERDGSVESISAVLRCAPRTEGPFPEYDLGLQAHVMRALSATRAVPVPDVLFLEESEDAIGVPFLIMRQVEGEAPLDRPSYQAEGFYAEGSDSLRAEIWRGTIEATAALHALDWREVARGRVPGSRADEDPARASLDYWAAYLRDFLKEDPAEVVEVFDEALDYLIRERPEPKRLSLCWGDAKLGNVLFAPASGRVEAVIDWEMATIGDPEQDLASLHLSDLRAQELADRRLPGTPTANELTRLYEKASGLTVDHFDYYHVFATFWRGSVQLAVMRQYRRRGVPIDDDLFANNFPTNHLRALLDLPGPRNREIPG